MNSAGRATEAAAKQFQHDNEAAAIAPTDSCPNCEPILAQRDKAIAERDALVAALKPVAELADRLDHKGHLEIDPRWMDADLTFPSDVELSVADLKRARATLDSIQGEGG